KEKIPQWLTIILILIFVSIVYYLIGLLLYSTFATFPEKFNAYSDNFSQIISSIMRPFNLTTREFAQLTGIDYQNFKIDDIFHRLLKTGVLKDVFTSFSEMMTNFFIVVIFWIFMLAGKSKFEDRLRVAFANSREMVNENIKNIDTQLQSYIIIKTILSLAVGIITTVILLAYGIDFALLWGFLAFILNYIPNIGSTIAVICPFGFSLLQYGFGFTTISLGVLLFVIHNVIGNVAEPHYLGRHLDLSPVFVLFSLIFWGWIWGIVGMFLAVPISAAIKILFSNIEPLKPIAILLGTKSERSNSSKTVATKIES
ncbi:MAG: AI-2E family transporter, partial [Ignavibacteriaceae bacterium]